MMKEDICRAFCNEIVVTDVPAGLAIGTPFRRSDGDAISVVNGPAWNFASQGTEPWIVLGTLYAIRLG